MNRKRQALLENLQALDGAVVALSGGVDSGFLLACAAEALGERVLAATALSAVVPRSEAEAARAAASRIGVRHRVFEAGLMDDPRFRANPPDRCRLCKRRIFEALLDLAENEGLEAVLEGSNADDLGEDRPGRSAAKALGVRAPLAEAGLAKEDVRALARERGLPFWDRPAQTCLATRIPAGEPITPERLTRIEEAERALHSLGFTVFRVRDHGALARVEVGEDEIARAVSPAFRGSIASALKRAGYRYGSLDLEGYRAGSVELPRR